ncbi:ribosome production factor 1 (RPF1) [Vairimorpha necatrix]|uniref:Ribosome production factor 1 (RPF1) n=1 Tax=Vairimorpha necatrix TaxID=6039 RepID=A0AAX4J8D3_9MICR
MLITIKEPRNMHEKSKNLIILLSTLLPSSQVAKAHPEDSDFLIDIIQDVTPAYLILKKKNEVQFALRICEYREVPTKFPVSGDTQLVLNNFSTEIGTSLAHFLMDLFPCNVDSKQIVNFTVKDEFLYFRMYQYCFSKEGPIFSKVGPHLSLRVVKYTEYKENIVKEFINYNKEKCLL